MTKLERILVGLGMAEVKNRSIDGMEWVKVYDLDTPDIITLLSACGVDPSLFMEEGQVEVLSTDWVEA